MPTHAAVGREDSLPTLHAHLRKRQSHSQVGMHALLQPESKPLLADSLCGRGATVACLQDNRLPGDDACVIQDSNGVPSYKLFTSGEEKSGLHGVGIAVQLKIANCVMSWRPFGAC